MCPPPQQQCGVGLLLLRACCCFFFKQNKKTEDTQQRSFIIELETIKKGTQKSAPPARALCLVQALLSSKNGPIDSGPTATSLWYLSASPFLYVCCLSLSIHNVHLWLFALAARDDQRIGFLFAALSSARR
jgi:hypothetical protein